MHKGSPSNYVIHKWRKASTSRVDRKDSLPTDSDTCHPVLVFPAELGEISSQGPLRIHEEHFVHGADV